MLYWCISISWAKNWIYKATEREGNRTLFRYSAKSGNKESTTQCNPFLAISISDLGTPADSPCCWVSAWNNLRKKIPIHNHVFTKILTNLGHQSGPAFCSLPKDDHSSMFPSLPIGMKVGNWRVRNGYFNNLILSLLLPVLYFAEPLLLFIVFTLRRTLQEVLGGFPILESCMRTMVGLTRAKWWQELKKKSWKSRSSGRGRKRDEICL